MVLREQEKSTDSRNTAEAHARRRGRRWATVAYYFVVGVFILIAAGNVTWQVWVPVLRHYPPRDCREGLRSLTFAVDRAREAAEDLSEADEDAALAEFRTALSPEWDEHDAIAASCHSDRELAVALDVIERL